MLLFVLPVVLIAATVACWLAESRMFSSPSVLFCGGFAVSALFLLAFAGTWGVELRAHTFFVICGGVLAFCAGAMVAERMLGGWLRGRGISIGELDPPSPNTIALVVFCMLELVVIVWQLHSIDVAFPKKSLWASIKAYNRTQTFTTETISFGFPLNHIKSLCGAGTCYVAYLVGNDIARKTWRSRRFVFQVIGVLLGMGITLSAGSRTSALVHVFSVFVCYELVARSRGRRATISGRMILAAVICAIAVFVGFKFIAPGRGNSRTILDYMSVYLGAPLANLNTFLCTQPPHKIDVWGGMTFIRTINYLGTKLHNPALVYALDLPFLKANGINLGNVYTTFYAYYYDFGVAGVVVLTCIAAAVVGGVYTLARSLHKRADVLVALYGYIAFQVFLSFFSNKLYENVISTTFLRMVIYFLIAYVLMDSHVWTWLRGRFAASKG